MAEKSNNIEIFDKFKLKFEKDPFIIGSITVFAISIILGIISSVIAIIFGANPNIPLALFINVALISLIFLLVGLLQREFVKKIEV